MIADVSIENMHNYKGKIRGKSVVSVGNQQTEIGVFIQEISFIRLKFTRITQSPLRELKILIIMVVVLVYRRSPPLGLEGVHQRIHICNSIWVEFRLYVGVT